MTELNQIVKQLQAGGTAVGSSGATVPAGAALALKTEPATQPQPLVGSALASGVSADDRQTLDLLRNTTLNVGLDTYYAYNFNDPVGRVNLLRAYDVLSNEFSLNQASVIVEHAPDGSAGRRWGGRLDLQFGQATDTLQGNPTNEPRPQIYRNIFQVYGTYVAAIGKGVTIDFGKWGSSLGIEGNYTKDQMNYSRALWFDFLPFYHMGVRATIPVNDRFSVNYWIVNGTNQVEATNGFKDELFGFTAIPRKSITWTMNYYLGQEHPDRAPAASCGPIPVQPGLCFTAIQPAPNGRTHIFDSYVTWKATSKLSAALEGDYFIQRLWKNAAPGESSAPSHVAGGAAYVQYQLTPKLALATRAEYMSDRGGIFSGITQALKENTVTFDYKLAEGFLMRYEWRRDFSNQPSFLSDVQGVLNKQQTTATLGMVWWWGRKEGSW
ncbi:MAG TPA: porin [Candidatus Sulfotelmatobacter sp.]|nr:porin [Candidatus Sulfotelmatobacter sp.]